MGRKRVIEAPALKSWEDVNEALRQIAEAQIAIGDIESEMQKQVLGAQKVAEQESKPYKDEVARLEREIKGFVTEHREDMGKTKSMTLTFGEVGFRLSTSVSLPRAKEKLEEIVRRLKEGGITRFLLLFRGSRSRSELVATFMAVLELCRSRIIRLAGPAADCTVTCREDPENTEE